MAMNPWPVIAVAGVLLLAAGCSGSMSTQRLSDEALNNTQDEIKGVVFYQPALFAEVTLKTIYVRDGQYVGRSTDTPPACTEVMAEKTVTLPDLKKPYSIRYHAGMFETSTFGVTLKEGMLASVNAAPTAAPTPSLNLPTPTGALMPLGIPAAGTAAAPGPHWGLQHVQLAPARPACNEGPVVVGYRRIELP